MCPCWYLLKNPKTPTTTNPNYNKKPQQQKNPHKTLKSPYTFKFFPHNKTLCGSEGGILPAQTLHPAPHHISDPVQR